MLVRDVMTKKVTCVEPETTIAEAAKIMRKRDIGALPVAKKNGVIGIVTDRDICCRAIAEGLDPENTPIEKIMSRHITTCFDDQDLPDAAKLMEKKQIRRLPVLDHNRHLVGMMTVGDMSHHANHELVGEVEDQITRQ